MNDYYICKELIKWLKEQKEDRWFANDVGRHTAYDAVLMKIHELAGSTYESKEDLYRKKLEDIEQHIKDKVRKSFEVDWGISDNRSDRLFTETIVELQIIERMIDDVLEEKNG